MPTVTLEILDERVRVLEQEVALLLQGREGKPRFKDWRRAVGMFPGNDVMKQIDEAGREIREADRRESAS